MMNSRFRLATPEITAYIKADPRRAFSRKDLEQILLEKRKDWMLRGDYTKGAFIDDLVESGILKRKDLQFLRHNYQVLVKEGKNDIYEIVAKASDKGYFSHLSAMYLNGLTEQSPVVVYLSIEQPRSRKNYSDVLSQDDIDSAFEKEAKLSNAMAKIMLNRKRWTIYQLFGSIYDQNELMAHTEHPGIELKTTSLERTLIDITIRPEYSGGVEMVRDAFQNAQSRVSVNRMAEILKRMNTVYPYHQAIGFWLQISGNYSDAQLGIMKRMPQRHDFYLLHGVERENLSYSKTWRLYYPSYLGI